MPYIAHVKVQDGYVDIRVGYRTRVHMSSRVKRTVNHITVEHSHYETRIGENKLQVK